MVAVVVNTPDCSLLASPTCMVGVEAFSLKDCMQVIGEALRDDYGNGRFG